MARAGGMDPSKPPIQVSRRLGKISTILKPSEIRLVDTSSQSQSLGPTQRVCRICQRKQARYTCPRCGAPYCSASCFQKHGEGCTERFYRELVEEELRGKHVAKEDKERTLEILKKHNLESDGDGKSSEEVQEGWAEEDCKISRTTAIPLEDFRNTVGERGPPNNGVNGSQSDGNDVMGAESLESLLSLQDDVLDEDQIERLRHLALNDEIGLEDLPALAQKQFMQAIASGELRRFVVPWQPWWESTEEEYIRQTRGRRRQIIEEVEVSAGAVAERCGRSAGQAPAGSKGRRGRGEGETQKDNGEQHKQRAGDGKQDEEKEEADEWVMGKQQGTRERERADARNNDQPRGQSEDSSKNGDSASKEDSRNMPAGPECLLTDALRNGLRPIEALVSIEPKGKPTKDSSHTDSEFFSTQERVEERQKEGVSPRLQDSSAPEHSEAIAGGQRSSVLLDLEGRSSASSAPTFSFPTVTHKSTTAGRSCLRVVSEDDSEDTERNLSPPNANSHSKVLVEEIGAAAATTNATATITKTTTATTTTTPTSTAERATATSEADTTSTTSTMITTGARTTTENEKVLGATTTSGTIATSGRTPTSTSSSSASLSTTTTSSTSSKTTTTTTTTKTITATASPRPKPSRYLKFHVVDLLLAYVCTVRMYNGSWATDPLEACLGMFAGCSAVLSAGARPESLSAALSTAMETARGFLDTQIAPEGNRQFLLNIASDVEAILRSKTFVLDALADAMGLAVEAQRTIAREEEEEEKEEHKVSESFHSKPKHGDERSVVASQNHTHTRVTGPATHRRAESSRRMVKQRERERKKRRKLARQIEHKLYFFLAWAMEEDVSTFASLRRQTASYVSNLKISAARENA